MSSSSSASDHESTANLLEYRDVEFVTVKRQQPRPFEEVWDELKQTLRFCTVEADSRLPSAADALTILTKPLVNEFAKEEEFDKTLFEALRECLGECELDEEDVNDAIVLKGDEGGEYSVAVSRQTIIAQDLCQSGEMERDVNARGSTSSGLTPISTPDHSVCIFQRDNNDDNWRVKDCLSIVELKMSDKSFEKFDLMDDGSVCEVDLKSKHSPLGQAIMYNMGCVLLCHARRGFLPNRLPLAIISGIRKSKAKTKGTNRKAKKQKIPTKLRWVSGSFHVPNVCGNQFSYSVEDFGCFEMEQDANLLSVKQALSLYLDTILFGLSAAVRIHNELAADEMPPPVPASGKCLKIGRQKLDCQLCASPINGANPIVDKLTGGNRFTISQGELFRGRIFLHGVLWQAKLFDLDFVDFVSTKWLKRKVKPVLVKVSSLTVHAPVVKPSLTMIALKKINEAIDQDELRNEIGTVLRAAVEMEVGLVTIMADLSKQGYGPLRPADQPGKVAVLWEAFTQLVKYVLLPLATIGIVHVDIRAGYDETSNIFCKLDKKGETASMKLVDYESLVQLKKWKPSSLDGRYIRKERRWNATRFVWWQCIIVAYTWHGKVNEITLKTTRVMELQRRLMEGANDLGWLADFAHWARGIITSDTVRETLTAIAELMAADLH